MRNRFWGLITAIVFLATIFTVRVNHALTVTAHDFPMKGIGTTVDTPDGKSVYIPVGKNRTFNSHGSYEIHEPSEVGYHDYAKYPRRTVILLVRTNIKNEQIFCAAIVMRRRVMLNYPPVSSPWHLPVGISQLTAILRSDGHEVTQRYGHIAGLEHTLLTYDSDRIENALQDVRNPKSDIHALYRARRAFEDVSRAVATSDRFAVERNNVTYVSAHYDGSIEGVLRAVAECETNLWYPYFRDVELPLAQEMRPHLYGIGVNDERQLVPALILASMVKDGLPDTLVVFGGNFWSRIRDAFADPAFAAVFNHCDAIVYKEGFQPIRALAATLDPSTTPGTVWLNGTNVIVNAGTAEPTSFEELPTPAFDGGASQWSPDPVYPLYTMSNCPMRCAFCAIAAGSDTFLDTPRAMSPKRIAEHMKATGGHRFDIFDETFTVPRQIALGKELARIGYPATWQCYLTVTDSLLREDVVNALADAGCRAVQLGLETLTTATLEREAKQWNHPDHYGRILENFRRAGIQTHAFVMVGIPGEPLHRNLPWLTFLEDYGDSLLTIKASRYRLTRLSPEEQGERHDAEIDALPVMRPLHLNRDFRYRAISMKRVDAMRDLLEEACRRHWAYAVTSTIPWWTNRGRYTWDEVRAMARELPQEEPMPHLDRAITKASSIVRDELGESVRFASYEDVRDFARTL